MIVLQPHLPFDPEETTLSFASRLAVLHTGRGMQRLLRDLKIDMPGLVSGRSAETAALAAAAAIPPDGLLANRIDVRQTHSWFRGERLAKAFLSPRAARYCRACLAEDGDVGSWRHRLIWGFRHVHRCDRHALWLTPTADASATSLHAVLAPEGIAQHAEVGDPHPEYLSWLRARLEGEPLPDDDWLKGQTLEQVLNASEMLGAILEHGHDVRVTKLPPTTDEQATDIGFSIYREGPEAVTEALDTIHGASKAAAVQAGPLAYYGRLFDWLDRRSNAIDPGPIRDILRAHIVKHFAIEPGTKVLGEEVTVRTSYTLQSLSDELRMDRRRLSRLLQKIGKVPSGATDRESGNLIFDAAETLPLIEAFQSAIRLHDLPEYLGASRRQIETLYRAGLLRPLVPMVSAGAVRNVVFARDHLDELLAKIAALPTVLDADRDKYHSAPHACQRGAGPFETVFPKIMSGDIPCHRDPGKRGIEALIVRLDDVLGGPLPA